MNISFIDNVSQNSSINNITEYQNINEIIIDVQDLEKSFDHLKAVDGINFQIQKGELFSLLGPNGAGKSTTIKMLTTVLKPSGGDAIINNFSLIKEKAQIRHLIGVCPQENVIFDALSAEENVKFVAHMHGMKKQDLEFRTHELLEKMGIAGRKGPTKNFSGGMKRRLNLVMSLINNPQILFLDEPTAGLDPQARRLVWDFVRDLKKTGMTIILTTHDMVEADALSDHIAIIDKGKIIALGTPDELKANFENGNIIEIGFPSQNELQKGILYLQKINQIKTITEIGNNKLSISFSGGIITLREEILNCSNNIKSLHLREDTLEDVFLRLTGRGLRDN